MLNKNKLKSQRIINQMTLAELSKATGITDRALNNYEIGLRQPKIDMLCVLADYFGVSIDWLCDREDLKK